MKRMVFLSIRKISEDKLLGKTQDLSLAPYTLPLKRDFQWSFLLTYKSKVTLGTDDFETKSCDNIK
jgi:hypothetical protein